MGEFNPQNFANTAWAFAKVDHLDEKLFAVLVGEAAKLELQVSEFKDRGPYVH